MPLSGPRGRRHAATWPNAAAYCGPSVPQARSAPARAACARVSETRSAPDARVSPVALRRSYSHFAFDLGSPSDEPLHACLQGESCDRPIAYVDTRDEAVIASGSAPPAGLEPLPPRKLRS